MSVRPAVWLAAILVIAIDVFTKQWALSALEPGSQHPLLGDVLSLQLVFNSGAAFSLGEGYTWILTVVAIVVTAGIVYYARRAASPLAVGLFGVALGGAVGNLIDRLFREPGFGRGHVVDMINYNDVFVGNVADIAIVGAAAVFMLASLFGHRLLEPAQGESRHVAAADTTEDSTGSTDAAPSSDTASRNDIAPRNDTAP
ncbi:signal peptidase II [Demequina sp. TTPB684]|uniref:signal peptidase II n=1 Tax=unclassified Demequina TaxID=2620311 RepID=UPI001CF518D9|nr:MULTISPECIES: signal peptidase II [unclassified Demequina]MCB2412130.1 signal peptidase II [Demequina sp. TTPB684]UPU89556.1 signal peptidase II [Demequina sp. TMPB413]